jgi:plasmid stabilization system protein ParE
LKVTYTEEAAADIVEAITYLNERNPTAAANLDIEIARCIERLADRDFEGPVSRLRSGTVVRSWGSDAISHLLPAPSGRAPDSARLPPEAATHYSLTGIGQRLGVVR